MLKEVDEKTRQQRIDCGWDEKDFAMQKVLETDIGLSFSPSERVAGYTDYVEWVCASSLRNTGVSWQTTLEIQEEWMQDLIDTYMEDVLGIKE